MVEPRPAVRQNKIKLTMDCRKFLKKYANTKAGKPNEPLNIHMT